MLTRTESTAEFWSDRQLLEYDDACDAREAAIARASDAVTLDLVLEKIDALPAPKQIDLMVAFRADRRHFLWLLDNAFEDAFDAAAEELARPR